MITAGKLVENVHLLLEGGKPTDDNVNLHYKQTLFILSYVTAHLLEEKRKRLKAENKTNMLSVDPTLLREYSNLTITDKKLTLPQQPYSMPDDMGLHKVLHGECNDQLAHYSYTQSMIENHVPFAQPHFVREGRVLHFKNTGKLKFVTLIMSGIAEDIISTDLFPIPLDLVATATEMAASILKGQLSTIADYTNDAQFNVK